MSKVVRIIFEYKEDVICKNSDGSTHRGVSLDIRSTGIKKKDNGPAMIFGADAIIKRHRVHKASGTLQ
ncbi:hypothetical protein ACOXNY_004132 [Escherichia coli]